MRRIKGSMLIDLVKNLKGDRSGVARSYLTEEDMSILSKHILSGAWYPFETYKHCFDGVFYAFAKGNMETVRTWGKVSGEKILTSLYSAIIAEGHPLVSIKKLAIIVKTFFDFGNFEYIPVGNNSMIHKIKHFAGDFEPFFHMTRGWVESCLELSGAKNVESSFTSKSWEGDPETEIRFSWTM